LKTIPAFDINFIGVISIPYPKILYGLPLYRLDL
jgi:hypothetical protein